MVDLLIRDLDSRLVEALEQQAARHGRSPEAEYRTILQQALQIPPRRTLAEVLSMMPDVGEDGDFERIDDLGRGDVFD